MKSLSVVIVNHNTKDLLSDCLNSLKKHPPMGQEVIVVDNCSSDGSVGFLKKQKGVRVVFNFDNLGFAKAVNQGLKLAEGEYCLLLNSDTIVGPGDLQSMIDFAKQHPDLGALGTCLLNPDGTVQSSCSRFPTIRGAIKEFFLKQKGAFLKYAPRQDKASLVDVIVGAVFLIPRKVIEEIGVLDERFFMYFEDFDYCRRIKKAGLKVYYLPKVKILHRHGASAQKKANQPNQWLVASSKIYHGLLRYCLITFIIWGGQKWGKLKKIF
ncbi:MAG: glycosyltransferase family 2 protein [Patescibacteria group bacterium]